MTENKLMSILEEFCEQKKYGEIVIKIEAGKIVRYIKTESTRP